MVHYLLAQPVEAQRLTWTLKLDTQPVYGLRPVGPFAREIYGLLVSLLDGQVTEPPERNSNASACRACWPTSKCACCPVSRCRW